MLLQRVLVVVVLLPFGLAAILAGDLWFVAMITLILGLAAAEYVQLFQAGGLQPTGLLIVGGVISIVLVRYWNDFEADQWLLPLLVLLSMISHLIAYERGRDQAATDFAATLGGIFYIGLLGSFFIPLRSLQDGEWWLLLILPAVWLADSGAFFIGRRFGTRALVPRLSPNKTWEGYLGGILVAVLGMPLLVLLYHSLGLNPDFPLDPGNAAILGLVMGVFPTLGDLGESVIKRQVGIKDSGSLLPGHGGVFDRIDSWLWAVVIGYFYIVWFF
ncbi:MAG: CDP-archaeol synthase [Chloroflexi bacterium]|nr:CDP-archaeol synthase [Chloroflexota bacterium]